MRWRLYESLEILQGSASTYFRWSGYFMHNFVKCLFMDMLTIVFHWNRFILIDAEHKLSWHVVWDTMWLIIDRENFICHSNEQT